MYKQNSAPVEEPCPVTVGCTVRYDRQKVSNFIVPHIRELYEARGVVPGVDYVVEEIGKPETSGKTSTQFITINVNGKPVKVNVALFSVSGNPTN